MTGSAGGGGESSATERQLQIMRAAGVNAFVQSQSLRLIAGFGRPDGAAGDGRICSHVAHPKVHKATASISLNVRAGFARAWCSATVTIQHIMWA